MNLSKSIPMGETPTKEVIELLQWVGILPYEVKGNDQIEVWQNSQVVLIKFLTNGIVKITKRMEY